MTSIEPPSSSWKKIASSIDGSVDAISDAHGSSPDVESKAAAICFSLVMNHPFIDGNKRVGHAAMETFLVLNGFELVADVDHAEALILKLAAGRLPREALVAWVKLHVRQFST